MRKIFFSILIFAFLISCKKEKGNDPLPVINNTPSIISVKLNSTNINQFDDLVFTIAYTDGNGDLGEEDADINSIFITDLRDNTIVHEFHLQPLAPVGQDVTIQGNLKVHLNNVILLDQNNTSENALFSVKIIDRAGNNSNTVTTSSVKINK